MFEQTRAAFPKLFIRKPAGSHLQSYDPKAKCQETGAQPLPQRLPRQTPLSCGKHRPRVGGRKADHEDQGVLCDNAQTCARCHWEPRARRMIQNWVCALRKSFGQGSAGVICFGRLEGQVQKSFCRCMD